jgi:hypothetical protein
MAHNGPLGGSPRWVVQPNQAKIQAKIKIQTVKMITRRMLLLDQVFIEIASIAQRKAKNRT